MVNYRALSAVLVSSLTVPALTTAAWAAPGTYDTGADSSYSENDPAIYALADFSLTDAGQDYAGGNITFSIDGANEAGETLSFATGTPSTVDDVITVSGTTVFKGNGTTANPIGNIDGTLDGDGADLRVNFSNAFENGDFSNGATGWTVSNTRVNFGYINGSGTVVPSTSSIGGFNLPIDYTWGPGASDGSQWDRTSAPNSPSSSTSGGKLTMTVGGGSCAIGFCVINGPIVISNASVYLSAGDTVSFDWAASAAGDAFNVYGYLLNVSTGKALKLIDETGRDSQSAAGAVNVELGAARNEAGYFTSGSRRNDLRTYSAGTTAYTSGTSRYDDRVFVDGSAFEAGNYKFVFVAGTYDDSGGRALGATFSIDNVAVSSAGGLETVTSADIQSLARLLTYANTTGINPSRTISFSSSNSDTSSGGALTKDILVTAVNDAPALATPSQITFTDTTAVDSFSSATRTLSATDEESDPIAYGISGVTPSGGSSVLSGTYGTLTVSTSGSLTFAPNATAINALDSNTTETFTLTASDGNSTGTAILSVVISAAVDTLPSAPAITSVTGADGSLSVVFSAPSSSGATAITNYKYSTDGTNYIPFSPAQTSSPLIISFASADGVTGLSNGATYPVTIRAVNSGGDSPVSNSTNGTPVAQTSGSSRGSSRILPTLPSVINPTLPSRAATPPQVTLPTPQTGPVLRNGSVPTPPGAPNVLLGGRPTTVVTTVPTTTQLDVRAGNVNLGVKVLEDQGQISEAPDGTTEIAVRKGAAATITGSGFRPGATVQVFMPLQGDNAKELTRIPVQPDGSFDGAAPFATRQNEAPLPIGKNVLQLVSLDNDGNQVVVEMTVNIAQGAPAPEQNRIDSVIPAMAPGQSVATSGGEPVPVRITPVSEQKLAVVEGDGWSMAVNVAAEDGGVEPSEGGALLKLVRNESALVSGSGFMPGTRADVWLFSDPTLLGTVTIDENGEFTGEVNIDPNMIPVGEHTLQLQGVGEDGYVKAANLGVLVDDPVEAVPTAVEQGLGLIWWIIAAIVLLALIVVLIASRRRRDA